MKPKKEPKYKKANAALRNTIFEKYSKTFAYPTDTWADFKEEFRERGKQRPEINFDIGSNARRYDSYEAGYHDGITDILWHMAIFGGFVIWFAWIEVAPLTTFLIEIFTSGMDSQNAIRLHLLDSVPYFRYLLMGMVLLLILRYRPKGIIPEKVRHS